MLRQWRHLKLMKRSGRGYIKDGITTTSTGECAVLCPACPHPGINIPAGYDTNPTPYVHLVISPNSALFHRAFRWLYRMFLAQDANFRARRLNVSNSTLDPCLNNGSAYLVSNEPYQEFLAKVEKNEKVKEDTSDCNNHDAIKSASIKGRKGVATTGIAAVECARHDMKRPASVTTLQKGERYVVIYCILLPDSPSLSDMSTWTIRSCRASARIRQLASSNLMI